MKNSFPIFLFFFLFSLSAPHSLANAPDPSEEELGYDEIVSRLSKKKGVDQVEAPELRPKIKLSAGYTTSFSNLSFKGQGGLWQHAGLQFTGSMLIPNSSWMGEAAFKNYANSTKGSQEFSARQLDFNIHYRMEGLGNWKPFAGLGLSTRFMRFIDLDRRATVDETSTAFQALGGLALETQEGLSLALVGSGRSPLDGAQLDRGALEVALNLGFLF